MKNYLIKLYFECERIFSEYIQASSETEAINAFKQIYRTHSTDKRYTVKI